MGRIINGDCLEVLRKVPNGAVKCIFMDIPDNLGMKYGGYDDTRKEQDYYAWIHLLLLEVLPKCKVFWLTYFPKHDLEIKWLVRDILKYRHPSFKADTFIWRYTFSQYSDYDCAFGFRPMLRLKRSDGLIYPDAIREISRRQELGDARAAGPRVPDNVWSVPRVVGNSSERCAWMPTQLPIKLMEKVISFSVAGEEVFLDCFGGSGSALKAGMALTPPRNVKVIEIDSHSCEMINNQTKGGVVRFDDTFTWS